jgi:spermidine/putrescine transport system substrate-binding protein
MTRKDLEAMAAAGDIDPRHIPFIRGALSRRTVLAGAGGVGVAAALAACGTGGSGTTGEGRPTPSAAEDRSDTDKVLNWSNWIEYIDVDDDGNRPTLDAFEEEYGITVNYVEDINDNNEFLKKVQNQLESGQDTGRDLVVLTDWMASRWIESGWALPFNEGGVPNQDVLIEQLQNVAFDPNREYTMPWQSGFAGLGYNVAKLEDLTGKTELTSLDDLWDPALKGRVTVLSEMRDTIGVIMMWQGNDPSDFTDAQFDQALAELQKQVDSGQIRQVTGNDYLAGLDSPSGGIVAAIAWSGDLIGSETSKWSLPESGGTLWTDNTLIPALAQHQKNAELAISYYYEPENSALLSVYNNYIAPAAVTRSAMEDVDPSLVDDPFIFPDAAVLEQTKVFKPLSFEDNDRYTQAFLEVIGVG